MTVSSFAALRLAPVLRREPWWAEFWSAITVVGWAGLSCSGGEFAGWPSMRVLTSICDNRCWGVLAFCLGTFQLVVLVFDLRWMRWVAAFALCWFWAVLTVGVWAAMPWAPGVAVYAGWCGINLFSILRVLRGHGR